MIKEIALHELRNIIQSRKFALTFAVVSSLIILSVLLGIRNYHSQANAYNTMIHLNEQEMREKRDWMSMSSKTMRKPEVMSVFVNGVNYDLGRYSVISSFQPVNLVHSVYTDEPFFAVFRFLDFSFIVTIVLSLFILVFTYDAINGEAASGTLKLIFSNPVPRASFLLGKFAGVWLAVIIPLLIPLLLSILLLVLLGVPLTGAEFLPVSALFGLTVLLCTFFTVLGIALSALIKQPSVSFLTALVTWVILTFIVPRGGIIAAGQIIDVPGVEEIKGMQEVFEKDAWNKYTSESTERWRERNSGLESMTPEEREAYREDNMWAWMEEDDKLRKDVQKSIDENFRVLNEGFRNKKLAHEKLALSLSRFSPVSSFQLAIMDISGTDVALRERFEDALTEYRKSFIEYKDEKQKESGGVGGIRITFESDTGFKIETSRNKGSLDISGIPRFDLNNVKPAGWGVSYLTNAGIISGFILALFILAFRAFLRFDVR